MTFNNYIVAVIGGAVAGSEAVYQLTQKGVRCVVFEQNPLPYGKIEDGLPKWHVKLRKKEMELIDSRLAHELVDYIPNTQIGKDVSFMDVYCLGWSAIFLANGAWRDRPFPIREIEKFEGSGFYYQNPFVWWFNHYKEPGYQDKQFPILDNALVVGGGLASIDVVKIFQIELVSRILESKGISVDIVEIDHKGIPEVLKEHGLTYELLGVRGCLLIYRRDVTDMPLVSVPENVPKEKIEAIKKTRVKILKNAQEKYLFRFQDHLQPTGIIVEEGKLAGLKVVKTDVVEDRAVPVPDSEHEIRASMVISSIGSIPEPIEGIPMKSGTYDIREDEIGKVGELDRVFGIGNVVTGKGNIQVSRVSARNVVPRVIERHLLGNETDVEAIRSKVKEWQKRVNYIGNYRDWVNSHRAMAYDAS